MIQSYITNYREDKHPSALIRNVGSSKPSANIYEIYELLTETFPKAIAAAGVARLGIDTKGPPSKDFTNLIKCDLPIRAVLPPSGNCCQGSPTPNCLPGLIRQSRINWCGKFFHPTGLS
ncbi:hypothetical protein TNCV_2740431 [Trichonephila clavipes]|nr:hypothetical protein TNCV_2740431 [Trichonephila clavipes]